MSLCSYNLDKMKKLIPQAIKNIYHLFQAILANFWFGFPSRKIKIIGITGTNGKTTVCQMVAKILEETGFPVAMASTINFKIGKKEWVNKTKFTTLSSWKVQEFISEAVEKGCRYLVLETSSHSLDQNRVWGVQYQTAVITNVTREHLDYHKNMDRYRKVKTGLFKKAKIAIVTLDMEKPEDFLKISAKNYVFSTKYNVSSSRYNVLQNKYNSLELISAEDIKLEANKSSFIIHDTLFMLHLLGEFNIENALAAISVGVSENIPKEKIKSALEKIQSIPGRLESIFSDRGFRIIVDYAVTPDSLEKLYALIKNINNQSGKIIAVFGACGERDRGKRPLMGEIVSQNADYVILTNEDPYNEEPMGIINEIFSGIIKTENNLRADFKGSSNFQFPISNFQSNQNDQNKKLKTEGINVFRILDRREAIKKALQIAKPNDFIIVTGKGAEETMAIGDKRIPWNDKKVIQEVLQELQSV